MSQYEQLYTLKCSPSIIHKDSHTIDLLPCDTAGNLLTRPQIDEADEPAAYSISIDDAGQTLHVVDPVTQTKLSTVSSSAPNKLRHVQLHNPETIVEFKNKTLLSFEWKFEWEDMRFAWNRSRDTLSTRDSGYTLKLGRKPDPDIAVAQYKLHKRGNLIQMYVCMRLLLKIDTSGPADALSLARTLRPIAHGSAASTTTSADSQSRTEKVDCEHH